MNKDLHDIDDLFRSTLEGYKEAPSPALKENLDAALDKKEAEEYKKRFIIWKRAALLLLLLLAGFVLYESRLIKTGMGNHTAKNSGVETEKISGNKTEPVQQNNNILPNRISDNNITADQQALSNDNPSPQQNQKDIITTQGISFITNNGSIVRKNNPLVSIISSQPDKTENSLSDYSDYLPIKRSGIEVSNEKIGFVGVTDRLLQIISLLPPPAVSISPATAMNKNIPEKKKINPFKPFWLISPFVSYDQAGYKLNSDDPLTATVIRHREVHEPSFSGGILAARQFNNHWSFQSGLVYTTTQIGISPQKMYALQLPGGDLAYKFITSSGYAYIKPVIGQPFAAGDSITTSDAKHLLKHISIPLSIKYKMGKGKLTFSPSAGVEANFITNAKVEVGIDLASNREIVTVNKLKGIKSFYWSAITGVEASCQINKKLSVNVQPVFRYALSPITKNNVVETFPRSFGIRAGVTLRF